MTKVQLKEEIEIELGFLEQTISELNDLYFNLHGEIPSTKDKTAAAAFLAAFYNGIENILKRIAKYHLIQMSPGESWHIQLFKMFCTPPQDQLPELFSGNLIDTFSSYRKFRHVFFHGYGFQLEWDRMIVGIRNINIVFEQFRSNINKYLNTL